MKILAYGVRKDEIESFKKYEKEFNHEVKLVKEHFITDNAGLAKGYEAICVLGTSEINRDAMRILKELGVKYVGNRSAGINNIDFKAAKEYGVRTYNVPAYSPNAIGEFAVTLALALTRNIHKIIRRSDIQDFSLNGLIGTEIQNQTIGFIGTGKIGLSAIKAFSGFGGKLIGYDIYPNEEASKYIEYKTLEEVFQESDIISMHCPLTEDNKHLINKNTLTMMKDGIVIINTSRGALMNTDDIIEGIKLGKIGGLATDVYEDEEGIFHANHKNEIIKDERFLALKSFPNVIVTPHCAFYTDEAVDNMVKYALENLYEFETKGCCKNELNK